MAGSDGIQFRLGELAELLGVSLNAAGEQAQDTLITGLATLENAGPGQVAFLSNPRYTRQLAGCKASAVILHPDLAADSPRPCLLSPTPYVCYAHASQLFADAAGRQRAERYPPAQGNHAQAIHASAVISEYATLGDNIQIGPNVVIEAGAVIGSDSRIGAGCYIGHDTRIGDSCLLYPNVTLYHGVSLGHRVVLHAGVVIGADGFGFAFDGQQSVKIAQLGGVRIGDDVEIGAATTVDRGALDDTFIGNGVKIDNQVQIGHNCIVGDHSVICGCSALAGSTRIGRHCVLGGGVGVTGHLSIADRVTVTAMSMVSQSIETSGVYSSGTLLQDNAQWKRNAVSLSRLAETSRTIRNIEKRLQQGNSPDSGNNYDARGRD